MSKRFWYPFGLRFRFLLFWAPFDSTSFGQMPMKCSLSLMWALAHLENPSLMKQLWLLELLSNKIQYLHSILTSNHAKSCRVLTGLSRTGVPPPSLQSFKMIPSVWSLTGFHTSREFVSHPFVNNPCLNWARSVLYVPTYNELSIYLSGKTLRVFPCCA